MRTSKRAGVTTITIRRERGETSVLAGFMLAIHHVPGQNRGVLAATYDPQASEPSVSFTNDGENLPARIRELIADRLKRGFQTVATWKNQ